MINFMHDIVLSLQVSGLGKAPGYITIKTEDIYRLPRIYIIPFLDNCMTGLPLLPNMDYRYSA